MDKRTELLGLVRNGICAKVVAAHCCTRMYSAVELGRAILWGFGIGMEGGDRTRIKGNVEVKA